MNFRIKAMAVALSSPIYRETKKLNEAHIEASSPVNHMLDMSRTNLTLNGPQVRIPAREQSLNTSSVVSYVYRFNSAHLMSNKLIFFFFILDPRKQLLLGDVIRKIFRAAIETEINNNRTIMFS